MTDKDKALSLEQTLRLALEALENLGNHDHVCPQWPTYAEPENYPKCNCGYDQAITTIKAALEAKGEPDYSICPTCGGMADDPIVSREHRFQSVELEAKDSDKGKVDQLRVALMKANNQAEHFEREWYLRGDEIERLEAALKAKDEPVAWRDAAIRLGEELSSVGPNGYYDMDAKEWLDWTMEQNPRGKHSLPQRTWVGLTDEECLEASLTAAQTLVTPITLSGVQIHVARVIEAKLKEKNGYA